MADDLPVLNLSEASIKLYMMELQSQRHSACLSAMALQKAIDGLGSDTRWSNQIIFLTSQGMLAAAGVMANVLWFFHNDDESEEGKFAKARGRFIRAELSMPKKGYKHLKNRLVRNALEHMDHRLDRRVAERPNTSVVDFSVGPWELVNQMIGGNHGQDLQEASIRHFDHHAGILRVLGEAIDLHALLNEVNEVGDRAQGWLDAHSGPRADSAASR